MRKPYLLLGTMALLAGKTGSAETVALTHVRLVDGRGGPAIDDATLLMRDGRILSFGRGAKVPAGARVINESGHTVLPGLISDHSHIGQIGGTTTGSGNYTRPNITAALAQYRRYGITTVTALGNNRPLFDTLRTEAHARRLPTDLFGVDQGIGVPNGAPPQAMTKSAPDEMFRPSTPAEARAAVRAMTAEHTDLVKIWVDDFAGTLPVKMKPEIYRAVIAESHRLGLRVAAHIHDLSDAQDVVAAGVDILAHGVRDKPVPADFVATLKAKGVWYIATLEMDEATVAWAEQQPWTLTPFARAGLSPALVQQFDDPKWRADALAKPTAAGARSSLAMNLRNLKTLYDAGVKIGFGTDSGAMPLRVPGVAEHRELALTVHAGLSPMEALTLATGDAATLLHLDDRGVIAPGKRADLLIVEGDPTRDITKIDRIVETWESGHAVAGPLPVSH